MSPDPAGPLGHRSLRWLRLRPERLDHHPTATTKLYGQLSGRHASQELLLGGLTPSVPVARSMHLGRLPRIGRGVLQPGNELVGLIAGEPSPCLTLREAHRTSSVTKIAVAGALEEPE